MDVSKLSTEQRVALLSSNYSAEAPVYERTWAAGLREIGRRLLDRMDISRSERLIDIGAGTGSLLIEMAGLAPDCLIVGVDRAEGMIALASPEHARAAMDATALAFASNTFDAATLAFMLFHLPDPLDGLKEARRVLRPGGVVGIATWGTEESWRARDIWNDELDAYGATPPSGILSQHDLVDSESKIATLLEAAGFVHIETAREWLRRPFDRDGFIDFVTGMAVAKRRLESLDPKTRERFLSSASERIAGLKEKDFLMTAEAIVATARKA